jgi:DNA polymerase
MDIITLDFETYYSKDFSLSKMTTEEYIRSPLFQVIGVGLKFNDNPTHWFTGDAIDSMMERIRGVQDKVAILCHNTAFDGAILSWHYNIKPRLWLDTLSMARPHNAMTTGCSLAALAIAYRLGKKGTEVVDALGKCLEDFTYSELAAYGEYCKNDVELTKALFPLLAKKTPKIELSVIDTTLKMYTDPTIELDKGVLQAHLDAVQGKKQALLDKLGGDEAQRILMSNPKFAELLRRLGVEPPMKTSLRTGKQAYAFSKTDKEFTALQDHPNPVVAMVVSARLGTKSTIEETRTLRLMGVADRGPLPIMLNYYGAHTGRFSGGEKLNLQNLPRGGQIRKALRAPKGHKLVVCDSSQIEARIVAYIAGQDDLVAQFAKGEDVYSSFATDVYGYKVDKSMKTERFLGKCCVLGLGYSMGADRFRDTLESGAMGMKLPIDEAEAKRVVSLYRNKNHKINQLWTIASSVLDSIVAGRSGDFAKVLSYDAQGIRLPNGLYISYPHLKRSQDGYAYIGDSRSNKAYETKGELDADKWTKIYGGKVVENVTQAVARIVVAEQMVAISKKYKVVLQVHDEVVISVPEEQAEQALSDMMAIMSTPPTWAPDLPVACEGDIGDCYGDAK